jgi:hypothetical protein
MLLCYAPCSSRGIPFGQMVVWNSPRRGIRPSHLEYYLDEFTFRFNRPTSGARSLIFYRLMEQAVDCAPVSRRMVVGGPTLHMVDG